MTKRLKSTDLENLQVFNRNSISRNTTHRQSMNLQAVLTGEMWNGQNKDRESKQTQDWIEYITRQGAI